MLNTLRYVWTWLRARWGDERGQALVEYGLIIALIAVAVILVLSAVGDNLVALFDKIGIELGNAQSQPPSQ